MPKKPKFKPEITRVKLNPEQAVLYCECYNLRTRRGHTPHLEGFTICYQTPWVKSNIGWCTRLSFSASS